MRNQKQPETAISPRLKTLLGSYRPEVEEVEDIPDILTSFGENGVHLLEAEVKALAVSDHVSVQLLERLTSQEVKNDAEVRRFFTNFHKFLCGEISNPPDIEDYT